MSRHILNGKTLWRIPHPAACYRCGKALELGDEIVVKYSRPTKYYHATCWDEMFMEL